MDFSSRIIYFKLTERCNGQIYGSYAGWTRTLYAMRERAFIMIERTDVVRRGSTRIRILGVVSMILGILAMLAPGLTGFSVLLFLGIIVIVAGIVQIFWATKADASSKKYLSMIIGILTLICGILLTANPLFASGVLTVLLALYFIIDGLFEIVASLQRKPVEGWGLLMFGGIVSLILGLLIWRQFPLAGVWAMGILIGIKLFLIGLIMVTVGSIWRSANASG